MNELHKDKISIRPVLPNVVINKEMTLDERFQNATLRPILKLQHELIVLMVKDFFEIKKNTFYKLSIEKKSTYIKNDLLTDKMIIHELRGIIIGLFTLEETKYYLQNKSAINKRIQALLFQRISSFAIV